MLIRKKQIDEPINNLQFKFFSHECKQRGLPSFAVLPILLEDWKITRITDVTEDCHDNLVCQSPKNGFIYESHDNWHNPKNLC